MICELAACIAFTDPLLPYLRERHQKTGLVTRGDVQRHSSQRVPPAVSRTPPKWVESLTIVVKLSSDCSNAVDGGSHSYLHTRSNTYGHEERP